VSSLASYRRLLGLAGPVYLLVAFLGRLPVSMCQLGTLLLVSSSTASYGVGGLAAGALAISNAVGAPLAATVADRVGQRPVVLVQSLAGAAALTGLVALAARDAPANLLIVAAAVTGLLLPQIGPFARARWRSITDGSAQEQRRLVDAAFAYEGAADEASFVLGPALIGVAAVLVSPAGGLLFGAAMLAGFGAWFALHPTSTASRSDSASAQRPGRLPALFGVLLAAQVFIGVLFGATQTGTAALATESGRPGTAGLVHALLGIGSVVAGLAMVMVPQRVGHERRVLGAAALLVVLSAPLLLIGSLAGLSLVVLLLGVAVGPYMIGVFTLGERLCPPERVALGMTLLGSMVGVGYAIGAGVAGRLTDAHGYSAAFVVTVTATGAAFWLSALSQRALRSATATQAIAVDHDVVVTVPAGAH
jgi:hypothetical protein